MAYDLPTPADLKLRYSAFADVDDAVVQYWLTDAERFVTSSWIEADYAPALMARAAHSMAVDGLGTDGSSDVSLPAGVTSFKSAELSVSLDAEQAQASAQGGLSSTRYGAEFIMLRRRSKAGPRVSSAGVAPANPWPYPTGAF